MASRRSVHPLWAWLRDETNRTIIAWIGSGLVVVASGSWVLYQYLEDTHKPAVTVSTVDPAQLPPQGPKIDITGDGMVAGEDLIIDGDVNFGSKSKQP